MPAKKGRGRTGDVERLAWLLPVTFAAHIAEEYFAGFPAWFTRVMGARLTNERFFEVSGLGWVAMAIGVLIATAVRPARIILVALATMVLTNAVLHVGASLVTAGYSPGTVTGALLWIPLGVTLLVKLQREVSHAELAIGIGAGVAIHAMVVLAALRR
jgi:hypothetical protein